MMRTITALAVTTMTVIISAQIIVPYAYSVRGYSAIGGEYCLIMMLAALVYYLTKKLFEECHIQREESKKVLSKRRGNRSEKRVG